MTAAASLGATSDLYGITGTALFICGLIGLLVTGAIVWITEYYTGTAFRRQRTTSAQVEVPAAPVQGLRATARPMSGR